VNTQAPTRSRAIDDVIAQIGEGPATRWLPTNPRIRTQTQGVDSLGSAWTDVLAEKSAF
jgi:hypothetical protein